MVGSKRPIHIPAHWLIDAALAFGHLAQLFHQHLAATIPVVFALTSLWQPVRVHLDKTAFDEPVHGARGQHEDAFQTHGAGALLDAFQDLFTIALAL